MQKNNSINVTIENGNGVTRSNYNKVLIAIGRKPNLELLKIENTDIKLNVEIGIEVGEILKKQSNNLYKK